jgi:hypothetical protein
MIENEVGEARRGMANRVQVSVVLVGDAEPTRVAWVLRALLADPADDFEIILIERAPHDAHAAPCYRDPRVHRFAGVGLSRAEARALGDRAAQAGLRVHVELGDAPGADDAPDDPAEAALLCRPALELLHVLRAAALAPAASEVAPVPEEVNP